jgi:antitoxin component of RelBE/YafQ-DinJ toxin-antitoxin module
VHGDNLVIMADITFTIDDELLQAARDRADAEGITLDEICRRALDEYARAHQGNALQAFNALMALVDSGDTAPAAAHVTSKREELYEYLLAAAVAH